MSPLPIATIRDIVPKVTEEEAQALAEWYANLVSAVAAFPEADLKGVEPPLRSAPGPRAR